ncbi:ABC transporter substrate-binding protein [Streptomyces sp. NPDC006393]|uniref:ABC transporter substrate-binding protein n=1 Tax=Streptomyces sp. NPDC006393 TaxID=3156763 RepID=UPI0033C6686C
MKRAPRVRPAVATALSALLLAAGCGGGAGSHHDAAEPAPRSGSGGADAAVRAVVNPQRGGGGTLRYEFSDEPDSFDPGNTYNGYIYNFSRLYARALTTFPPKPGDGSGELTPDLAASLGTPSDGGRTWTYHLRPGLKFSDGTSITSKDVKYAVERSNFAPDTLSNGPRYFRQFLVDNPGGYKGPYRDPDPAGLRSIATPDDTTIVFHLNKPFADFDYLVSGPQTAPVPREADTGAGYEKAIVSSGSYKFEKYVAGKEIVLVRNEHWSAASDPLRQQNPDRIVLRLHVPQQQIDDDLIAGRAHVDLSGRGVTAETEARLWKDPALAAQTDNALGGSLTYLAVNSRVKPFDDPDCRKAVQYAVDKAAASAAAGGPRHGQIATTLLPPDIPGSVRTDLYRTPGERGDKAAARKHLRACGRPDGFSVTLAARQDRPGELAVARSLSTSLAAVGIRAEVKKYPSSSYFSRYVGVPAYAQKHRIGLMMMEWGADWATGYGFMQQIVDGRVIRDQGNTNLSALDDPRVDSLLDRAITTLDTEQRNKLYGAIDRRVMEQAVIVPLTYFKVVLYRSPHTTNVVSSTALSGQYDYLNIGVKK